MFDRCPNCVHPMEFHAITVMKGHWRKWMFCSHCTKFTHVDQFGANPVTTNNMPQKYDLARDEKNDDDGNTLIRFGQDYVQPLPEL